MATLRSPLIEALVCIFLEVVCIKAGLTYKPPDYSSTSGITETSMEPFLLVTSLSLTSDWQVKTRFRAYPLCSALRPRSLFLQHIQL